MATMRIQYPKPNRLLRMLADENGPGGIIRTFPFRDQLWLLPPSMGMVSRFLLPDTIQQYHMDKTTEGTNWVWNSDHREWQTSPKLFSGDPGWKDERLIEQLIELLDCWQELPWETTLELTDILLDRDWLMRVLRDETTHRYWLIQELYCQAVGTVVPSVVWETTESNRTLVRVTEWRGTEERPLIGYVACLNVVADVRAVIEGQLVPGWRHV